MGGAIGSRLVAVLWVGALFTASGCTDGSKPDIKRATTLEKIRKAGVVRVGYANEAPYAYLNTDTGEVTGEAPMIARVIMKKLGVKRVEGVLTEFGALIPGLKAGRFDVIAAGMYVLPERCDQIAFTNPTYRIGEGFLVKKGNPMGLRSYEDAASNPEVVVGVVAGSVELSYARKTGIPKKRISILPDAPSAVAALQADRIHAYAGTSLTVNDMLQKAGDSLEIASPFSNPVIDGKPAVGYGAFGIRKEDVAFLAAFNKGLSGFIGAKEHLELVEPFGFSERETPGGMTADDLCNR
ncbi:MAG: ectoine/hydroxyectoine ABC transporter substrate-binding protein EhuB [Nitrospinota bacterium]|nr:ectoine/hydroxyectoine ABC transporter substrate-binding protein EhuB [Nitrospinota bacterium]